jgi:N-acetylglucosamine-6-phosphate deacetylase
MPELTGRSVFTNKPVAVTVEGEKISRVDEAPESGSLPFISPGFLDMQVNGFNGVDYSLENLEPDQIEALVLRLARSGTARHVATFITMPPERLLRNLALTAETMEKRSLVKAAIPAFHLEGPFISPEDGPRGAHDKRYTMLPDLKLFEEWQEAARGHIKLVTLAPELPGAPDFIRALAGMGVRVAIGHTAASPECIREAADAGASCSTHLGNGSHSMIPRHKNYIWEQMACDSLMAGIICDGFHLPPAVVKVTDRAKGRDRLILVSDVSLPGGYKPGLYRQGDLNVEVYADGHLGIAGTSALAGAAHLLDWDIVRFMEFTGASLKETIELCTARPARFLGLADGYTALAPGCRADLTVFSYTPGDRALKIRHTLSAGRVVFPYS